MSGAAPTPFPRLLKAGKPSPRFLADDRTIRAAARIPAARGRYFVVIDRAGHGAWLEDSARPGMFVALCDTIGEAARLASCLNQIDNGQQVRA